MIKLDNKELRMEEKYYVIRNGDGDTTITEIAREELIKALAERDWGDVGFMDSKELKENNDTNYWGDNLLIIKGKIIIPEPEKVVESYFLE
jgi:hypothetical protein